MRKRFFAGLVLLVCQLVFTRAMTIQTQPRLPNIIYFTRGYDIYLGNPLADSKDPGFSQEIFNLTYDDSSDMNSLVDGQYLPPDNVIATAIDNCQVNQSLVEASNSISLISRQGNSISGSAGISFDSFGASASGGQSTSASQEYDLSDSDMLLIINGLCDSYEVSLQSTYPQFSDYFLQAVKDLPETYSDFLYTTDISTSQNPYLKLLSQYGTHYVTDMILGSRLTSFTSFTQEGWASLQSQGYSSTVNPSLSFLWFSAGISKTTNEQNSIASAFNESKINSFKQTVGRTPDDPDDSDLSCSAWQNLTIDDASPLTFDLTSISQLLVPEHFEAANMNNASLLQRQSQLNTALIFYCSWKNSNNPSPCFNLACDSPNCDGTGYKFNGCPGLGIMMTEDYGNTWTCVDPSCPSGLMVANESASCSLENACVPVIPSNDLYMYSCYGRCSGTLSNNGTAWMCEDPTCEGNMVWDQGVWQCQSNTCTGTMQQSETGPWTCTDSTCFAGTMVYNESQWTCQSPSCDGSMTYNQTASKWECQSNTCTGTMNYDETPSGNEFWHCYDDTCPGKMVYTDDKWTCQSTCPGSINYTISKGWSCYNSTCGGRMVQNNHEWYCKQGTCTGTMNFTDDQWSCLDPKCTGSMVLQSEINPYCFNDSTDSDFWICQDSSCSGIMYINDFEDNTYIWECCENCTTSNPPEPYCDQYANVGQYLATDPVGVNIPLTNLSSCEDSSDCTCKDFALDVSDWGWTAILNATCQNSAGNWVFNSLNLAYCFGAINGTLSCGSVGWGLGTGIELTGMTFSGNLSTENSTTPFSLSLDQVVGNLDGDLVCDCISI